MKDNAFTVAPNLPEACKNLAGDEIIPKPPQFFKLGCPKSLDIENKIIKITVPD